jgi:hypothetical protein
MKHAKAQIKKIQATVAKDARKEEECNKEADKAQKEVSTYLFFQAATGLNVYRYDYRPKWCALI